jgi:hypothetical protein
VISNSIPANAVVKSIDLTHAVPFSCDASDSQKFAPAFPRMQRTPPPWRSSRCCDLSLLMPLVLSIRLLTNGWQEGRRRALTENFAMRKVPMGFGGVAFYLISHPPLFSAAGRALASKGRGQGDTQCPQSLPRLSRSFSQLNPLAPPSGHGKSGSTAAAGRNRR